jgi:multisubunit Na+/H+ antiporter MnhG subunit
MENLMKYLGAIIILLAVVLLAVHCLQNFTGNFLLAMSGVLLAAGLSAHIAVHKYF